MEQKCRSNRIYKNETIINFSVFIRLLSTGSDWIKGEHINKQINDDYFQNKRGKIYRRVLSCIWIWLIGIALNHFFQRE